MCSQWLPYDKKESWKQLPNIKANHKIPISNAISQKYQHENFHKKIKERSCNLLVKAFTCPSEYFQLHFFVCRYFWGGYHHQRIHSKHFIKSFALRPICIKSTASFHMSWAAFIWLPALSIFLLVIVYRCSCGCTCRIFALFFKQECNILHSSSAQSSTTVVTSAISLAFCQSF